MLKHEPREQLPTTSVSVRWALLILFEIKLPPRDDVADAKLSDHRLCSEVDEMVVGVRPSNLNLFTQWNLPCVRDFD
jgi:hypothetical protein